MGHISSCKLEPVAGSGSGVCSKSTAGLAEQQMAKGRAMWIADHLLGLHQSFQCTGMRGWTFGGLMISNALDPTSQIFLQPVRTGTSTDDCRRMMRRAKVARTISCCAFGLLRYSLPLLAGACSGGMQLQGSLPRLRRLLFLTDAGLSLLPSLLQ